MSEIRTYLDEHVANGVALGLKRRGIEAQTANSAGMSGASDADHLAFARRESRVVFTRDRDFLRLASEGHPHAGILFTARSRATVGFLVRELTQIAQSLSAEEMVGRIEFI